jgi:putative ABC transport system permease protein
MAYRAGRAAGERLAEAFATIRGNPLRAGLATLAVAAAVSTMAIVVTALDGVERAARERGARTFGSDAFVVARVAPGQSERRVLAEKLARNPVIRRSDVRFLDRYADGLVVYAATAQASATITAGSRRFENAAVAGTTASLGEIRAIPVARGRFLVDADDRAAALVAVVGADIADELLPGRDPLGEVVRLGGRGFRVVGVLAREGLAGGAALDRTAFVPLTAFERVLGASESLQVLARGTPPDDYLQAEDRTRTALRARRHLEPGTADTFDVITPEAARSFVATLSERVSAAAVPISLMALLAAIVVVTNTMLVSVTERTREIGVRRALGASRRDVTLEVVAESAAIGLAGGVAGALLAGALLALATQATGLALPLRGTTLVWSVAAAVAAGILAGWYPARRAARMDVIAALRQE